MSGFSLSRALAEAIAFVPKAWVSCWLSLLMLSGLGAIALYMKFTDYGAVMWSIAFLVVILMVLGGLYRAAVFGPKASQAGLGFGGIQLGGAEWRLVTGGLYNILFLGFISLFAAMFVVLVASKTELSTHYNNSFKTVLAAFFEPFTSEKIVIMAFATAIGLMLLSLLIGLLPYQVASVAQNRTISINALRFSQGKLLKMLLGLVILVSPLAAITAIAALGLMEAFPNMFPIGLLVAVILIIPLTTGFFASIYRQSPPSGMTG